MSVFKPGALHPSANMMFQALTCFDSFDNHISVGKPAIIICIHVI